MKAKKSTESSNGVVANGELNMGANAKALLSLPCIRMYWTSRTTLLSESIEDTRVLLLVVWDITLKYR